MLDSWEAISGFIAALTAVGGTGFLLGKYFQRKKTDKEIHKLRDRVAYFEKRHIVDEYVFINDPSGIQGPVCPNCEAPLDYDKGPWYPSQSEMEALGYSSAPPERTIRGLRCTVCKDVRLSFPTAGLDALREKAKSRHV